MRIKIEFESTRGKVWRSQFIELIVRDKINRKWKVDLTGLLIGCSSQLKYNCKAIVHTPVGITKITLKTERDFANEIANFILSERKSPNPQTKENRSEYKISWDHVKFSDNRICVEFPNQNFKWFDFPGAKKSFNYLKHLFIVKNLRPIILKGEMGNILNFEELKCVVQILDIVDYYRFADLHCDLKRSLISPTLLTKIPKALNKSTFINYLIDKAHNKNFPVYFIPEVIIDKAMSISRYDSSFIFISKHKNQVHLIWESVEDAKATYIFNSSSSSLPKDLQKVNDYLRSPKHRNKRQAIIDFEERQKELSFKKRILHSDSIGDWKQKLKEFV